jgi:hypothetical protein
VGEIPTSSAEALHALGSLSMNIIQDIDSILFDLTPKQIEIINRAKEEIIRLRYLEIELTYLKEEVKELEELVEILKPVPPPINNGMVPI